MSLDPQMDRVVTEYLGGLDTPLAYKALCLYRSRALRDLVALRVYPHSYTCSETYFKDACAVEFLRKCEGFDTGIDLEKAALATFFEVERENHITNQRLLRCLDWQKLGFFSDHVSDQKIHEFILKCRSVVAKVLGPLPLTLVPKFGPGATFSDRGLKTTIPHKMSTRFESTPDLWWASLHLEGTAWERAVLAHQIRSAPKHVPGNRFTTVPKDSTKHRGICIEPSVNLAFQLAVGAEIRTRLLRAGIDLKHGQQIHQKVARRASISGEYATIDLSNASDTVTRVLVQLLLPENWFSLLDDLRSKRTLVDGKWYYLEKFSSMGNGFTFELESLLFYAMGVACCELENVPTVGLSGNRVRAYGDDIIIPTESSRFLLAVLPYFGFTPNRRKTFTDGPFRESCGGDFFSGKDVRPYYLKKIPHEPQDWISMANGIRRVAYPDVKSGSWRLPVRRAWHHALAPLPNNIRRLRGPRALGDLVIHDDHVKWLTRSHHTGQHWIRVLQVVPSTIPLERFQPGVQLAAALYGVPSTGPTTRSGVSGFRIKWMPLLEASE